MARLEPVLTPDADNSTLSAHNATGSWEQNLAAAHNANYSSFAVSSSSSWSRKSSNFGQSQCGPAITTHAGDLWISGVMNNHSLWYTSANNTDYLQPTTSVNTETAAEGPALADFADVLHLVFPDSVSGKLVHLQYNDTTGAWGQRLVLNVTSSGPPALTVFNGALVLAYMDPSDSNRLYVAEWDPVVGWGPSYNLGGQSWGTPALYTLGSQIYILFPANNSGRKVLAMSATAVNGTWTTATAPNESTAYGTSAATYETNAVMAFQSNNGKGQLFASFYNGAAWLGHEDTGQTTSHTPAIVVLDGIANCVFSSHDASSSVLWIQRPVSLYPLNSWMAHLSGSLLLSQLSIPGTHDSASVTFVPFTATQELSIPAQLDLGIRFLDLRCKLVFNSLLMFHGDVPLGPTLQQILLQIYSWLGHSSSETVIVSLKQEGSALNSTITFDTAVLQLIQPQSQFWNTSGTIPQLQDIRGKIQLISRYGGASIGINATNWPDNVPGFTTPLPNGALAIEDYYDYDGVIGLDVVVTNKTGYVLNALAAAQADTSISNWYISFSTASNTPFNFPETLAVGGTAYTILGFPFVTGINRRILTYLNSLLISPAPYPKVGTVLMDFPDTPDGGGLIEAIVSLNG
ncbi:PLC-like phosphodiesterase [Mycena galericulata]|nr:PLC-like phosphodiesterase [Mycena galericulata]